MFTKYTNFDTIHMMAFKGVLQTEISSLLTLAPLCLIQHTEVSYFVKYNPGLRNKTRCSNSSSKGFSEHSCNEHEENTMLPADSALYQEKKMTLGIMNMKDQMHTNIKLTLYWMFTAVYFL